MKQQTAVEWLVEHILTEVRNYKDDDIENEWDEPFKHEYVNKYIGMIDLSEYVIKAKEMEKEQLIELLTKYHDGLFYVPFKDGEAEAIYNHLTNRNESKTNI